LFDAATVAAGLWILGEVHARQDPLDVEAADRFYRASLRLTEELGMRPIMARCRLSLGVLYQRAERPEPARQNVAAAFALFQEMGMRPWSENTEGETE